MKSFAIRLAAGARDASVVLLITVALLGLLEGFSSFLFVVRQPAKSRALAERLHTEHDSLLGWINKPNMFIPDMYGPEKYLRTNSQRFRNNVEFADAPPPDRTRWICAGDSFTLGYGVANDHSWCSLLTSIQPGIEPVNMGQGGKIGRAHV